MKTIIDVYKEIKNIVSPTFELSSVKRADNKKIKFAVVDIEQNTKFSFSTTSSFKVVIVFYCHSAELIDEASKLLLTIGKNLDTSEITSLFTEEEELECYVLKGEFQIG
jgi:hypothetical protein